MMRNEPIRNEFKERNLDCELSEQELSDQEVWEKIYGRNTKPFDWRKSNIRVESPFV